MQPLAMPHQPRTRRSIMKRIFLLVMLLACSTLAAAEQYSKDQCDDLKAQKAQIRNRMNQDYAVSEGNWLNKRDRELFQLIDKHCSSPIVPEQTTSTHEAQAASSHSVTTGADTLLVYTTVAVAPTTQPDAASRHRVTVDKNFHQHFTWFGIAFVVFVGLSSWIIWRK